MISARDFNKSDAVKGERNCNAVIVIYRSEKRLCAPSFRLLRDCLAGWSGFGGNEPLILQKVIILRSVSIVE